jgi:hypothetical protein
MRVQPQYDTRYQPRDVCDLRIQGGVALLSPPARSPPLTVDCLIL